MRSLLPVLLARDIPDAHALLDERADTAALSQQIAEQCGGPDAAQRAACQWLRRQAATAEAPTPAGHLARPTDAEERPGGFSETFAARFGRR